MERVVGQTILIDIPSTTGVEIYYFIAVALKNV